MDDDDNEPMELEHSQKKFIDLGYFDRRKVDLNKTPMSVEEYLKQVIVDREQQPVIAVAPNYRDIMRTASTSGAVTPCASNGSNQCSSKTTVSDKSRFGPDKEWCMAKSNEFSLNRSVLEAIEVPDDLLENAQLPLLSDTQSWCQICFERRLEGLPIAQELEERFAHHTGTPPTMKLLKSLNDQQVNTLVEYQIAYICKNGHSRARLEWIYALMLVLKKPLLHEVVAALRDFCRKCREWRALLDEDELELIYELSWFIAIISIYFSQRDLAD